MDDVNHLGKHLDESKDQADPLNAAILLILDKVASLIHPGVEVTDQTVNAVATQANNIRGKFLDMTKSLKEAIPDNMLTVTNLDETEVPPSTAT
jgi:hypothetical protein